MMNGSLSIVFIDRAQRSKAHALLEAARDSGHLSSGRRIYLQRSISIVGHARDQISRAHAFLRDTHGLSRDLRELRDVEKSKKKLQRVSLRGIDRSRCLELRGRR